MPTKKRPPETQLGLGAGGVDLLEQAAAARRTSELRQLDPRRIVVSPHQPRGTFDPDRLAELADSIREQGLLQPILVRQRTDGVFELLAGERRQRAAIAAGLERIPARVLEVSDEAAVSIALTENLAREDLSPWEEAVGLSRLRESLDRAGGTSTRDRIARAVGRSAGSVSESLQIADRLDPLLEAARIDPGTLAILPKTALLGAAQGKSVAERVALLRLALTKAQNREAAGKAVEAARPKRGRPVQPWTVSDRLRDRGTLSFSLRRKPEDLAPEEARNVLARLAPLVEALRARADSA